MTTETDRYDLRGFFEQYAHASQATDPRPLAAMYAPSFIVGGPRGSMCFPNDARFLDWLTQVSEFNRAHRMSALVVVSVNGVRLSPLHVLATVRWGARFERLGEELVEFQIAYLLEKTAEGWKILSYISQADQEEEMKKLGLLGDTT